MPHITPDQQTDAASLPQLHWTSLVEVDSELRQEILIKGKSQKAMALS